MVLLGRFVQGLGVGGKTLCDSWIATAIPLEKQKTIFTIKSIIAIAGIAIGPLVNIMVAEINMTIEITTTFSIHLNPLNSVGLLVACNEVLLWVIVATFVKDPPPPMEKMLMSANLEAPTTVPPPEQQAELHDILKALTNFKIWFTLTQMFVISANYCLYVVAIAPVAANMLNWTPVEISNLFAFESIITLLGMGLTLYLSVIKMSDFAMLSIGHGIFAVSGTFAFLEWRKETASVFKFVFPLLFLYFVHPFSGPAIQASFNEAVFSLPEIAGSIGVFQSFLSQSSTLARIIIPPLVMSYVVKGDSQDVSQRSHELSLWALYAPLSSLLMIFGLLYEKFALEEERQSLVLCNNPEEMAVLEDNMMLMIPNETSKLVSWKEHMIII